MISCIFAKNNKVLFMNNDELIEQVESFLLDNYSITNENYNRFHLEIEKFVEDFVSNYNFDEDEPDYEYFGDLLCSYTEKKLKSLTIL